MSDSADPKNVLGDDAIASAVADLPGWAHTDGALTWTGVCSDDTTAIALFNDIAAAAQRANHHPDVLWSYNEITLDVSSHDVGGITVRDLELARTVSQLAADRGVTPLGETVGDDT